MLAPTDIQRIKKLVDDRGDQDDKRAFARIVLTLFNQTAPKPPKEKPDPDDIDAYYNDVMKTLNDEAS